MRPTPQADARAEILRALRAAGLPGDARIREAALPAYTREELAQTIVTVSGAGFASERIARDRVRLDVQTDVAVQRAVPSAKAADGLPDLDPHSLQGMEALFGAVTAATWRAVGVLSVETLEAPSGEHLAKGVWTGVIRVKTYGAEVEA